LRELSVMRPLFLLLLYFYYRIVRPYSSLVNTFDHSFFAIFSAFCNFCLFFTYFVLFILFSHVLLFLFCFQINTCIQTHETISLLHFTFITTAVSRLSSAGGAYELLALRAYHVKDAHPDSSYFVTYRKGNLPSSCPLRQPDSAERWGERKFATSQCRSGPEFLDLSVICGLDNL
jgi:hypothetical protein